MNSPKINTSTTDPNLIDMVLERLTSMHFYAMQSFRTHFAHYMHIALYEINTKTAPNKSIWILRKLSGNINEIPSSHRWLFVNTGSKLCFESKKICSWNGFAYSTYVAISNRIANRKSNKEAWALIWESIQNEYAHSAPHFVWNQRYRLLDLHTQADFHLYFVLLFNINALTQWALYYIYACNFFISM